MTLFSSLSAKRRNDLLCVITGVACIVVGFVWNCSDINRDPNPEEKMSFQCPDTLLYLRWLEQDILRGEMSHTDEFQSFPVTQEIHMPSLPRHILLQTVFFFYTLFPNAQVLYQDIVGFLPPLAGAFVQFLFILFAFKASRSPVIVACVALAQLPSAAHRMVFSYLMVDHHYLETLIIWSWVFCAWNYCRTSGSWNQVVGGILTGVYLCTWLGAPFLFGLMAVYGTYAVIAREDYAQAFNRFLAITAMIGASWVMVLFATGFLTSHGFGVSSFGYLHPVLLFSIGAFSFFLAYQPKLALMLVGILVILFFTSQIQVIPILGSAALEAEAFIMQKNPFLVGIAELGSIFRDRRMDIYAKRVASYLPFVGPLLIIFPLVLFRQKSALFHGPGKIWRDVSLGMLLLMSFQIRYARWAGPGLGLLIGCLFYEVFFWFKSFEERVSKPILTWGTFGFILLMQVNSFYLALHPTLMGEIFIRPLVWMRERTPPISGYDTPGKPEYGVLAFWDLGNAIAYYAQRAPVVSNTQRGMSLMARIFISSSEDQAIELMNKNKVKYVYMSAGGLSPSWYNHFHRVAWIEQDVPRIYMANTDYAPASFSLSEGNFHYWLNETMGIQPYGSFKEPTRHLLCRFFLRGGAGQPAMIFEVVPGALVEGTAPPGTNIQFELKVTLEGKGIVEYAPSLVVPAHGRFSARVAYPSGFESYGIKTDPHYKVLINGKDLEKTVEIPEEAVLHAQTINIQHISP